MRGVAQTQCRGARKVEIFFLKGNPMFQLDSYLFFDGTCADAMHFYQQTLAAKSK